MTKVGLGDVAPTFEADATDGQRFSLQRHRGAPVVLVFYPGDATPVCTRQLKNYTEDSANFEAVGAEMVAISPQGLESHEAFKTKESLGMPLLHDANKEIGQAYGIVGPLGFYRRSVFVIGPDGRIAYARRGLAGLSYVPASELLEAVEATRS